jgi:outer membrane protein assembly factor BamD
MYRKIFFIFIIFLFITGCSKKEEISVKPPDNKESYKIYAEALEAMNQREFFFAAKKFSEAEKILPVVEHSAKALLMSSFCYYTINFHEEAITSLEYFLKKYPADKNIQYATYLIALSNYEQILDEKKDIEPLLKTKKLIEEYVEKYPNTDYTLDLKFKLGLIQNQLAAKEVYIAKFYIKTQKWIPAINRLKIVVNDYPETIFIEEALHRLVEIYYNLGLVDEAKKTAKILGYNYNSSKWYENSYSLLNKDYKEEQKNLKKSSKEKEQGLVRKTIKKILNK